MPTAPELGITNVAETVTRLFHIDLIHRGTQGDFLCPVHEDRNPSASIHLESGLWSCLACGATGDILKLGSIVLGRTREEIEKAIGPNNIEAVAAVLRWKMQQQVRKPPAKLKLPGPYVSGPMDYMLGRGFTLETCKRWGLRYVSAQTLEGKKTDESGAPKHFTIRDSIAIPVRAADGKQLGWYYRATDKSPDWQPKYLPTPGLNVKDIWLGSDLHRDATVITVCEGALDAIWLDQAGIPALAMLGANMISEKKIQFLRRYRQVVLFADRDAAGVKAITNIGNQLAGTVPVKVVRYAKWMDGKDPQDLPAVDLELAVAAAQPWTKWIVKQKIHLRSSV